MNTDHSHPERPSGQVLVIGESLIDIVRKEGGAGVEVVGGSPANVALGLGRLGTEPRLLTALGHDNRGRRIASQLEQSGVRIDPASWSLPHTATAAALIDSHGRAQYEFDIAWTLPTPVQLGSAQIVHCGSIATFLSPGADTISAFVDELQGQAVLTFDPNIRPALVGSHAAALARVERLASRADVVKLSDEDANWLWPAASADEVLNHLLDNGARLVALTLGGAGAVAATNQHRVRITAPRVNVVDTVGAGDTFMAALIYCLVNEPRLIGEPSEAELAAAIHFAVVAASLTVQRAGADLPTAAEVRTARQSIPDVSAEVGSAMSDRVSLHATFTARQGDEDRVAELIGQYAQLVREEPGNLLFEASRLRDRPERFFVYEIYRDGAAFQEHLSHTAGRAFNAELTPLIVEPASKLTFLQLLR